MRSLRHLPITGRHLGLLLPTQSDPSTWSSLLLGVHLLPLQNPGIPRHISDNLIQRHSATELPPRVPPCCGAHHVLLVAAHGTVSSAHRVGDECDRSYANVRVLYAVWAREKAQMEEACHGLSDCSVCV